MNLRDIVKDINNGLGEDKIEPITKNEKIPDFYINSSFYIDKVLFYDYSIHNYKYKNISLLLGLSKLLPCKDEDEVKSVILKCIRIIDLHNNPLYMALKGVSNG